jgi:hypothetical protein
MTVRISDDRTIVLAGDCPEEDAEALVGLLLEEPAAEIDWSACQWAHTAVVQVLLASRRTMRGSPKTLFLRDWIEPLLAGPVNHWP